MPELLSALPEWRVMVVTNISTGEAHEVGRVRAATAEEAQQFACAMELVRNFQTFRVERADDATPDYISVSVKAPDPCPPLAAQTHAHPQSEDEFFAIFAAIPPEGEPKAFSDHCITADLGGDHSLYLYAPKALRTAQPSDTPSARFLHSAVESWAEQRAEDADEQRAAAEDDPRGAADR